MSNKFKRDLFFMFCTFFCIFFIVLLLASFSSYSAESGFTFASGLVYGFLISQFLFLFFKSNSLNVRLKKTKRGKRRDNRYWWNDGEPPSFKDV